MAAPMLKSRPPRLITVHFVGPRVNRGHKDPKGSRDFRAIKALKDQLVLAFPLLERYLMKPVLILLIQAVKVTSSSRKIPVPALCGMVRNGCQ